MATNQALAADARSSQSDRLLVLVIGGDLGLGGSDQPLNQHGGVRHGSATPWQRLGRDIVPLLDGDINFANLETVVTDNRRLGPMAKTFNFRMHATGARHLVKLGFNVFSTANNHAIDYGQGGMRETWRHLALLKQHGLLAFPGIARGRKAALAPAVVRRRGHRLSFAALGIGGAGVTSNSKLFGQLSYRRTVDFQDALGELKDTEADYRILSVHYGRELQIRPSSADVAMLRDQAVRGSGVDLIIGHHAHVAAGVQRVGRKLIFYGLGNLLHLGMQNMAKFGPCRDFGLMARVFLARGEGNKLEAQAVQVIPLTNMHENARPLVGADADKRIAVLNGLASGLDDSSTDAHGLRFRPRSDGTGVFCMPGKRVRSGRLDALCGNRATAMTVRKDAAAIPVHRCGPTHIANRRGSAGRTRKVARRNPASRKKSPRSAYKHFAQARGR